MKEPRPLIVPCRARKQIRFEGTTDDAENDTSTREGILKLMSINAVRRAEKQQVKVIIPRGDSFSIRTPPDALTAALILNLCNKNWKAVANSLFKRAELKVELESVLYKTVSKEMSGYCQSDSVLKHGSAHELSSFRRGKYNLIFSFRNVFQAFSVLLQFDGSNTDSCHP